MTTVATWGVCERGATLHAFRPQTRPGLLPRALCGMAWSPTKSPAAPPGIDLPVCRTCRRLADGRV